MNALTDMLAHGRISIILLIIKLTGRYTESRYHDDVLPFFRLCDCHSLQVLFECEYVRAVNDHSA